MTEKEKLLKQGIVEVEEVRLITGVNVESSNQPFVMVHIVR